MMCIVGNVLQQHHAHAYSSNSNKMHRNKMHNRQTRRNPLTRPMQQV